MNIGVSGASPRGGSRHVRLNKPTGVALGYAATGSNLFGTALTERQPVYNLCVAEEQRARKQCAWNTEPIIFLPLRQDVLVNQMRLYVPHTGACVEIIDMPEITMCAGYALCVAPRMLVLHGDMVNLLLMGCGASTERAIDVPPPPLIEKLYELG